MVDILIMNARFLVCDAKTIIEDGAVAVEKNRIVDVGKTEDLKKKYKADKVIDARWKVVMPGLIDCHVHGAENLFRGLGYGTEKEPIAAHRYWRFVAPSQFFFNSENIYFFYLLTYAEMIKNGTTSCIDMYFFPDAMCKAAHESGLRGTSAPYVYDLDWHGNKLTRDSHDKFIDAADPEEQLRNVDAAIRKWHGADDGRIRLMYGPHTAIDNSVEHLQRVRELATKHGVGIKIHLQEGPADIKLAKDLGQESGVLRAFDAGLLAPDVCAAHCVWLTNAEIKIIAQTGTKVIHDGKSNMMLGAGVCPVPELLEKGVTVALGSNGSGHSADLDMFINMKIASILQKLDKLDDRMMPAPTVFEMATVNGAKALGLEKDIGSIKEGKKADIILVDIKDPRFFPIRRESIMNHLVYTTNGNHVNTVIVDGKILMENRQLQTINEETILEKGQLEVDKFMSEYVPKFFK